MKMKCIKEISRIIPDKTYLKIKYMKRIKKILNLKNPKTFNEKMQWMKIYDRKDIYTEMVDKYQAKAYVSKIIGKKYIIPTYGIYDKFEDIEFDKLPNEFVVKTTHNSGGILIVNDKNDIDIDLEKQRFNEILKKNYYYYSREWPYKNVKPRIIVEEKLDDKSGDIKDYKFFCFNGNPEYILVCSNRFKKLKETFYDTKWNLCEFKRPNHEIDLDIEKPKNLELMINLAKKLSKGFDFLRVDFYENENKVYFGELTFYPASGLTAFEPEIWDEKLGNLLKVKGVDYFEE